jgi:cadmium resistance protein CadD (predicted permease)
MPQGFDWHLLGIGIVVFASTNVDDLLVLSAFFSDRRFARRSVIVGQFAGIGALVLLSVAAAVLAWTLPDGWLGFLGVVPLLLGIAKLWDGHRNCRRDTDDFADRRTRETKRRAAHRLRSQILSVAAVTIANGGDNLGVYVPLFATSRDAIPAYGAVFIVMTALWCALGYSLVNNRLASGAVHRYGHRALPFVLMALGLYILSGTAVLFR